MKHFEHYADKELSRRPTAPGSASGSGYMYPTGSAFLTLHMAGTHLLLVAMRSLLAFQHTTHTEHNNPVS